MLDHDYHKFYKIQENDFIVDLGATTGEYLKEYGPEIKAKNAMVLNVEPAFWNLKHLIPFVEENYRDNAMVLSCAASQDLPTVELVVTDSHLLHHVSYVVQHWGHEEVYRAKVPAVSIGAMADIGQKSGIDFIKCDIEGAELELFLDNGEVNCIKNAAIAVYHIVDGEPTWKKLKPFFESQGFKTILHQEEGRSDGTVLYISR